MLVPDRVTVPPPILLKVPSPETIPDISSLSESPVDNILLSAITMLPAPETTPIVSVLLTL